MFRRIISLSLALLLIGALVITAFAAEPASAKIYFDTTTAGWTSFSYVGFHIWGVDGEAFYDWGGKAQRGTDEGNGIWSYDLEAKGVTLDPEKQYAVIFYNDKGSQTYNLLFDTTCFGDVAEADLSHVFENPEDSQKATLPAYWQHQDPTINGPELKISSIGNVVGECCPKSTTREAMFEGFLLNTLENARQYTEQSDQELIDNVGEGLEIGADAVELIIATSGVEVSWSYDASTLCKEPHVPSSEEPTGPDWYEFSACVAEGSGTAKVSADMWDADAWEDDEGITLTAEPAEGYHFGYWEIIGTYRILEGNLVSPVLLIHPASHITAKAHLIETLPGNSDYVAYTVDVTQGEGTAEGDKDVLEINYTVDPDYQYDTLTLTATAAEGYCFDEWEIEGSYELEDGCKLTDATLMLRVHDGIAAHAKFCPVLVPTRIRGDADADRKITILDATRIQRYIAKLIGENKISMDEADATRDGKVTILDATRIQRVLAKLCGMDGGAPPVPGSDQLIILGGDGYEMPVLNGQE